MEREAKKNQNESLLHFILLFVYPHTAFDPWLVGWFVEEYQSGEIDASVSERVLSIYSVSSKRKRYQEEQGITTYNNGKKTNQALRSIHRRMMTDRYTERGVIKVWVGHIPPTL